MNCPICGEAMVLVTEETAGHSLEYGDFYEHTMEMSARTGCRKKYGRSLVEGKTWTGIPCPVCCETHAADKGMPNVPDLRARIGKDGSLIGWGCSSYKSKADPGCGKWFPKNDDPSNHPLPRSFAAFKRQSSVISLDENAAAEIRLMALAQQLADISAEVQAILSGKE